MTDRLPRKLAAILYADVAGYSRLTGDDEDATHRTLSKYLDLIAHTVDSHRGQVMHYAGDAVLARFDAVVDALSSATDIQRQLADQNVDLPDESKVHFRIGVNLGDVIEDRGDIFGDGVNIAARLESLADPGGICISEAVRSAVNKKLDLNYEDMGEPALKNIEEPVRAYRVVMVSSPLQAPDSTSEAGTSSSLEFTPPTRPSIAILPFKSLGSDPDQDFLADGIRLGIQATLVQLSGLFLINAPALNTYRHSDATATAVGSELGVRYVLEGSAQQAGDRIRVTVQLTDIDAKQAIWAERYDRTLDDIFKLQDEITWEVIVSLNVKIQPSESVRVWFGKLTNAEAREYYYRGVSLLYEGNKDDNALSRHMFEELYRVEPASVIGPSNISVTHWLDAFIFLIDNADESIKQAAKWARKAMQYDDNNGIGHAVYGHLQLLDGQYEDALATCSEGIKLRSSCPLAHGLMGLVLNYSGDARGAIKNLREALQLEQVYPAWMIDILAAAYRDCGDVELSISAAKESIRLSPQKDEAQLILCSDYELTDNHDQARRTAEKIIANNPVFRLANYARSQPYQHPAPLERVIDALREAGLPE
jgi:class 3 adenylate cyclase/tetratricopeptide (TPR) repeat protein